jgi:hypothetical protein
MLDQPGAGAVTSCIGAIKTKLLLPSSGGGGGDWLVASRLSQTPCVKGWADWLPGPASGPGSTDAKQWHP